jgi:hypothetical protein
MAIKARPDRDSSGLVRVDQTLLGHTMNSASGGEDRKDSPGASEAEKALSQPVTKKLSREPQLRCP